MPLPHSIHLLLNHVSDCMRRARSTAGSSRDARSLLCSVFHRRQRACGDHRAVLLDARIDRCCFRSLRAGARTAHNRPQGQTRICLKILGFRFLPSLRLFVSKSQSLRLQEPVSSSFVSKSQSLRLQEPVSSSRVAALRCQSSSGSMERSTSTFPSGSAVNQACARGCGPGAEGSRQASAGAAEASGEGRRRSCSSRRRPRWRRL